MKAVRLSFWQEPIWFGLDGNGLSASTGEEWAADRILPPMSDVHPAAATALPVRFWRLLRLAFHLFAGMLEVAMTFRRLDDSARMTRIQRWAQGMLRLLSIRLVVRGSLPPQHGPCLPNTLLVANHVSWIDVFVMDALIPAHFVAKTDVAGWPLIGWLARNVGTLFIDRENRRDVTRVNGEVAAALRSGQTVAFFPEGTTTDGTTLLPFTASLFHAATEAAGSVQPIALRYRTNDGQTSFATAYVGETTLIQSFWRIASARELVAELTILPVMNAAHIGRRELAAETHRGIGAVVNRG